MIDVEKLAKENHNLMIINARLLERVHELEKMLKESTDDTKTQRAIAAYRYYKSNKIKFKDVAEKFGVSSKLVKACKALEMYGQNDTLDLLSDGGSYEYKTIDNSGKTVYKYTTSIYVVERIMSEKTKPMLRPS